MPYNFNILTLPEVPYSALKKKSYNCKLILTYINYGLLLWNAKYTN